jgi:hypothetical protein
MRKTIFVVLVMTLAPFCAFGVDGTVLINQSTVMATGGFPYKITQPGSYRLSGNLTVPDANTTAIQVLTDNVTIDLNGFSIVGPVVCSGFPSVTSCSPVSTNAGFNPNAGVAAGSFDNIAVVNGVVRGMGQFGIILNGRGSIVRNMRAMSNGFIGIAVNAGSTVSGNTATANLSDGIFAPQSTVSGNAATQNGGRGLDVQCPSSVVSNTASGNAGGNLFTLGAGCAVANNAAP